MALENHVYTFAQTGALDVQPFLLSNSQGLQVLLPILRP